MESIKKLEEAAKNFLKDFRTAESRASIIDGAIQSLEAKRVAFMKEIAELEVRKAEVLNIVANAEMEAHKAIEKKMQAIRVTSDEVLAERATLKGKIVQADAAREDMQKSKAQYDTLYAQYEAKLAEFNQKRLAAADILK